MLMLNGDDGMGSWEMDLKRVTVSMNGRKEQPEGHQELKCHFGQKRFANTKISTDLANQLSQRWSIDLKLWEKRSFASWLLFVVVRWKKLLRFLEGHRPKTVDALIEDA
jgi:hypothetical protein